MHADASKEHNLQTDYDEVLKLRTEVRVLEQCMQQIQQRLDDAYARTAELEAQLDNLGGSSENQAGFRATYMKWYRHLITALVQSETEHGRLSKDELTSNISLLFAAGHETTVNLMGNGLIALYRNREQLDRLRADPSLMPNAVEEFLRYDSSVQLTGRDAMEDAEIAGVALPRGRAVLALLAAANRDPDACDRPDELDITRERIKPVSFGGGIHLCLGAQLARIEAHEALNVLLERLPNLELQDVAAPDWKQTITLRGVRTLPATW